MASDLNRITRRQFLGAGLAAGAYALAGGHFPAFADGSGRRMNVLFIAIDDLRAVGGLARSDQFLQLKANMMGTKIASLVYSEAGTIGVAILAGTATGLYTSIEDAVRKLVRVKKVFEPDKQVHAEYQARFAKYKHIYPAVRPIFTDRIITDKEQDTA